MITDRLFHWARATPGSPFLIFQDRVIDYGEMAALTNACAARLRDLGVGAGDHVAVICGNRPAFLAVWFALSEIGAVTVPLNVGLLGDGLRYVLTQSGSGLLLIEPELLEARRADLANLPLRIEVLDESYEQVSGPPPTRTPAGGERAQPNCILFTSGTTGLPKGAVISHSAYEAAGGDMAASLGLTSADRTMVFLPLFHANPQMYAVMSALACGSALVLLAKFSAGDFFEQASRYRATGFTYVGSVLSILAKRHPHEERGHGLRWCVGGGAPPLVWRAVEQRFGLSMRELYGMTETGGWVSMNTAAASRFGSVGLPREGVYIQILDERGRPCPPGAKGEIVVSSARPHLFFNGYWDKPELTDETLRNGWLHTGDRGWLDEDGYLFFDGRVKDLIRRGGEMIAPAEIETQLLKHPLVSDCAAAPVDDEILGEEIKVVIVASGPIDPAEVRAFLAARLPRHMLPRYFVLADHIPKTETHKIQRHQLTGLPADAVDLSLLVEAP